LRTIWDCLTNSEAPAIDKAGIWLLDFTKHFNQAQYGAKMETASTWREEWFDCLNGAQTYPDIFNLLVQYCKELGFQYCEYGMRLPLPISRTPFVSLNNYPKAWQQRYKEKNYFAIDPTVQHALKNSSPIIWSGEGLRKKEFWKDAWGNGLRHGWTQASREPNGTIGILTFARTNQAITSEELDEIEVKLNWLTHTAHRLIASLIIPDQLLDATCKLSPREKEILRWTAEGKTCKEIGWILEITERTVNFHVNNAMTKLRASNKTHAAVKAALLGVLFN
jgi:LuxR family transcriptional regulator, quorum-sensing system regulator SolR